MKNPEETFSPYPRFIRLQEIFPPRSIIPSFRRPKTIK